MPLSQRPSLEAVTDRPDSLPELKRIPSLDGLRAVSIFLVLALHSVQRYSLAHPVPLAAYMLFNGSLGVNIFFVISGFLITSLLLQEHRKNGSISLSAFYVRRAFRILPPLYTYIATIVVLCLWGKLAYNNSDIVSSAFFFHNFSMRSNMWSLEHLWSISVEEQFYLVWPFILYGFLKGRAVAERERAAIFPIAVLAISPVLRMMWGLQRSHPILRNAGLKLDYDFIMFGCLVALLQGTPRFESLYRAATRLPWLPPALVALFSCLSIRFEHYFDLPLGYTLNGAAISIFLLWCTRNPQSLFGRMLNSRPLVWVGVLSYSIYLWQTLFLHHLNTQVFGGLRWISTFPGNWLAILLVACTSYYLLEQPSLKLRGYLLNSRRASGT